MSVFKSTIDNRAQNSLGVSGAGADKEAFDYVIDAIQETSLSSSFISNTKESAQLAQETSVSPTAPRKIVYGRAKVGGNIVWRISPDNGETQLAIVWCEGEVESIEKLSLDGENALPTTQRPLGYYGGNFASETMLGGAYNDISDSFLISKKPTYWDYRYFFGGCAWSYIFLRFNQSSFPNGFPQISAVIEGKKLYDPRKDSTAGSILHNSALGTTHRFYSSSTWEFSTNAALCLLNYMTDSKLGLDEPIEKFDAQSLRDAIDLCDENVIGVNGVIRQRYSCNGVLYADATHRENIKQLLTSMNGKLIYSNGKYHIKPYDYQTPHSQIIDESMIVGSISYSAKQGRADTYNRVKGKFTSAIEDYTVTDYPVQYSGTDADGLTYDDKDGQTIYLDYNLPFTNNNEDAQRLARLMMLRSRMQATVNFKTNMKGLAYKIGDTIQFSNEILGYTNGTEKDFEITDYKIFNDIATGITVEITAKETALAIYNWSASDAIDYTADGSLVVWDGFLPAVSNVVATVFDVVDNNLKQAQAEITWDFTETNQFKHYLIKVISVISTEVLYQTTTINKEIIISTDLNSVMDVIPLVVEVIAVSTMNKESDGITSDRFSITTPRGSAGTYYYESTNTNAITDDQFIARFGFSPESGDRIIVYTVDADGAVTDTKRYIFQAEMTIYPRLDQFGHFGPGTGVLYADGIARNDFARCEREYTINSGTEITTPITWTYTTRDPLSSLSLVTGLTTSQPVNNKFIVVLEANQSFHLNAYHYEQIKVTVTATWATGTITASEKIFTVINTYYE